MLNIVSSVVTEPTGKKRVEKYRSGVGVLCIVDLRASHGPEGKELHEQSRATRNLPRVRAISSLLQYVCKFNSSVRTNGEVLQNTRHKTRDIFCQLHQLFFFFFFQFGV